MKLSLKKLLTLGVLLLFGVFALLFGAKFAFNSASTAFALNDDTTYNREYIPIEEVSLTSSLPMNGDGIIPVRPEQSVDLKVMLTPQWAIATVQKISYHFKNGALQADIVGNTLTVKRNATIDTPITVVAVADGVDSNVLTFTVIEIPVESVRIINTEKIIAQGSLTGLNVALLPENATYKTIVYSVIEGSQFATITAGGVIRVNSNLPVGEELKIKVKATSLKDSRISDTREFDLYIPPVEEKIVYAERLEVTSVFSEVRPGDVLTFTAIFPEPANVSESQKDFYLTLESGHTAFAEIFEKTITINNANTTIKNPTFVVRVNSDQDGTIIFQDVTITVYIPVTSVALTQRITEVNELDESGQLASYNITDLLIPTISPANSNVKDAEYSIVGGTGANFVEIINNSILKIKPGIRSGSLTFIIRATAEGKSGVDRTFTIYVAASEIFLSGPEYAKSTPTSGETVQLTFGVDSRATSGAPKLEIVNGAQFVESLTSDGKLTVKKGLAPGNGIEIKATRDGKESEPILVKIYVPIETLTLSVDSFQRGDNAVNVVFNGGAGATNEDFEVTLITVGSNVIAVSNFDIKGRRLKIPETTQAGITVTVHYRSLELDGVNKTFTQSFTVAQLNKSLYTHPWGKDNAPTPVQISQSNPQLHVGRSTIIALSWNNIVLPARGVTYSVAFVGTVSVNDAEINGTILTIKSGASGSLVLTIRISIRDSINNATVTHTIDKVIKVFRPIPVNAQVRITNAQPIANQLIKLNLASSTNWDSNSTYGISKLQFVPESGSYVSIDATGNFTVKSANASVSQSIKLTYDQPYNDTTIPYSTTASLTIRWITLDRNGGSGGDTSIIGVVGYGNYITNKPQRPGYTFNGWWTATSGGDLYYDLSGNLQKVHSQYASTTTLYARWVGITYKVQIDASHNGGKYLDSNINTYECTYGSIYIQILKATGGCIFTDITAELGSITSKSGLGTSEASASFSTLTIEPGKTVKITFHTKCDCGNCIAEGTLITLADGSQKPVEDLNGSELLLVWNLYTGKFEVAPLLFVEDHGGEKNEKEVIYLKFSDGTEVKVIYEHGFFSLTEGKYVYLRADNAEDYIGQWFNKLTNSDSDSFSWSGVQLVGVEVKREVTTVWSPIPLGFAFYANGMLSVSADTGGLVNIFDVDIDTMRINEAAMQADIELYGLLSYEVFADYIPFEIFEDFNLKYFSVSIGKGLMSLEELLRQIAEISEYLATS